MLETTFHLPLPAPRHNDDLTLPLLAAKSSQHFHLLYPTWIEQSIPLSHALVLLDTCLSLPVYTFLMVSLG